MQTEPKTTREIELEKITSEAKVETVPYLFYILEQDHRLVVYEAKTGRLYMDTGIFANDLPAELYEELKIGIFFETEADLYDFLESYSS